MRKSMLFLSCWVVVLVSTGAIRSEAATDEPARIVVSLSDGSRLYGTPSKGSFSLDMSFVKVDIPLKYIQTIEFEEGTDRAVVRLLNGDRLSGSLALESLEMKTVFGKAVISRTDLKELSIAGAVISGDVHTVSFVSSGVLRHFCSSDEDAWSLQGDEAVGRSTAYGRLYHLTYGVYFRKIKRATVWCRIVPPNTENFRWSVGPINMIFNWECARENHYRNNEQLTRSPGHALQPGKVHKIIVAQEGEDAVLYVDGKELYRTRAQLEGTVTVYPGIGSTVAVSKMEIVGEADLDREVTGHSHTNTY